MCTHDNRPAYRNEYRNPSCTRHTSLTPTVFWYVVGGTRVGRLQNSGRAASLDRCETALHQPVRCLIEGVPQTELHPVDVEKAGILRVGRGEQVGADVTQPIGEFTRRVDAAIRQWLVRRET